MVVSTAPGRIALIGSGETTPTMVGVHREIFALTPPGDAVLVDTTFGFQLNADELVARTQHYFAESLGRRVDAVSWRRADAAASTLDRALARISTATWVFAGPGSPSYALRQWRDTPMVGALGSVIRRGGTLVLGSAAAITVGKYAVPVYEVYKAGFDPYWDEGLDLLGTFLDLELAVIPHFDNAEGGTHDTRYCYLGEPRLAALERELPDGSGILGIDEHTAVIIDVAEQTVRVTGNRTMTLRARGRSRIFPAGSCLQVSDVRAWFAGEATVGSGFPEPATGAAPPPTTGAVPVLAGDAPVLSLHEATLRARTRFDAAAADRDAATMVDAILGLEQAIQDWSADTLQSSDRDEARRELRSLIVRLGEFAQAGALDTSDLVAPFVTALLDVRSQARSRGDYQTADDIRERLIRAGVEVRDTPDGVRWLLPEK
ncbi:MAG: hypothetical protein IRZ27_00605 [Acidothermus cellulolyticus]|nr:hypothetical protein [Acidothermus cellulolyticus]